MLLNRLLQPEKADEHRTNWWQTCVWSKEGGSCRRPDICGSWNGPLHWQVWQSSHISWSQCCAEGHPAHCWIYRSLEGTLRLKQHVSLEKYGGVLGSHTFHNQPTRLNVCIHQSLLFAVSGEPMASQDRWLHRRFTWSKDHGLPTGLAPWLAMRCARFVNHYNLINFTYKTIQGMGE